MTVKDLTYPVGVGQRAYWLLTVNYGPSGCTPGETVHFNAGGEASKVRLVLFLTS